MTFENFKTCILQALSESYEGKISLKEVRKLNGVKRYGVLFEEEGKYIAPTIYLEGYYNKYIEGTSLEVIRGEILEVYEKECDLFCFSVKAFQDFELTKEQLFMKLIHYENNKELLMDTPYIPFLEYAIVAYYELRQSGEEKGSILIKDVHLELWGHTNDEILQIAIKNSVDKKRMTFEEIRTLMLEFLDEEDILPEKEEMMYVLSNVERFCGASVLYYPDTLQILKDYFKEDFYILPSSVHELIVIPSSKAPSEEELLEMVRDVNDTQVEEEEILSYNILFYNFDKNEYEVKKL